MLKANVIYNVAAIQLPCGRVTLVDTDRLTDVLQHNWVSVRAGRSRHRYVSAQIDKKRVYLHRYLRPDLPMIDHINRNGLDNRVSNFRETDHSRNIFNQDPTQGVRQLPWGSWQGVIKHMYRQYSKCFRTREQAVEWRQKKAAELFGD